MSASRRHFLRAAGGLAAASAGAMGQRFSAPFATTLAGIGAMASQSTFAADDSGYRALVCLFMQGGNDSHNWVVPFDATGYAEYANARGGLAWTRNNLQAIASTGQSNGRSFAMPQELSPLRDWYAAGAAAVVANVGPLVRPITKLEYQSGIDVPRNLFSHNDQASTWQSMAPEGAASGWGGRMGDLLMSANQNPVFTAVSTSGNAVFLSGSTVTQYEVSLDGPIAMDAVKSGAFNSNGLPKILQDVMAAERTSSLEAEYARVLQRANSKGAQLQAALSAVSAAPPIPQTQLLVGNGATLDNDNLAKQLRMVARLVNAGQSLGMRRQVFMVSIGGFDSHSNQLGTQPMLMARVAHSANYFLSAMRTMGMLDKVTLFTASDFGRTLLTNGSGSDHGWGSHHFVAGGAVRGGTIYGRFPTTALNTSDDTGSGRLLPSTSVTQYAATMARWMGVGATDMATVLPNVGNFSTAGLDFI